MVVAALGAYRRGWVRLPYDARLARLALAFATAAIAPVLLMASWVGMIVLTELFWPREFLSNRPADGPQPSEALLWLLLSSFLWVPLALLALALVVGARRLARGDGPGAVGYSGALLTVAPFAAQLGSAEWSPIPAVASGVGAGVGVIAALAAFRSRGS